MPITREQNYQVRSTAPLLKSGISIRQNYDAQYSGIGNNTWTSVCWSPALNLFCAVASDGTNRIMTSPDGEAWTVRTTPIVLSWVSVAWSTVQAKFIAVASDSASGGGKNNNQVVSSSNGTDWVHHDVPTVRVWTALAVLDNNPSSQVAIVSTTGHILGGSTTVGTILDDWVETISGAYRYDCVSVFGTTKFAAAGPNNRFVTIQYGSPLTLTPALGNMGGPLFSWKGICWSQSLSKLFAVSMYDNTDGMRVAYSNSGTFWNPVTPPKGIDARSLSCFEDIGLLFATGNSNTTSEILLDNESDGDVPAFNNTRLGQTFVTPDMGGIKVGSIVMYLKLSGSSVESNGMYVDIYTTAANVPTTLVVSSSVVNKNTLTTNYQAVTFEMNSIALDSSTTYAFVFRVVGSYSQYPLVQYEAKTYGTLLSYSGGSWTVENASLCKFQISMTNTDIIGRNFRGALTCYADGTISQDDAVWITKVLAEWDYRSAAYSPTLKRVCTVGVASILGVNYGAVYTHDITQDMEEIFGEMDILAGVEKGYQQDDLYAAPLIEAESDTANITGAVLGITGQDTNFIGIKTIPSGVSFAGSTGVLTEYDEGGLYSFSQQGTGTGELGLPAGAYLSQVFLAPDIGGVTVNTISLRIKLSASSVETNSMYVDLYTLTNGAPGGGFSILLRSSAAVNKNTLTTSYQTVNFNMGAVALTKSVSYAFRFRVVGAHTQYPIFEYDTPSTYADGSLWGWAGSWTQYSAYDLSHWGMAITFIPISSWDTDDGPAPITVNWSKFTRVGPMCFIDMSITWGSQTAAQTAMPVSIGRLPFDGNADAYQFLSMNEARDPEAYSVYYTHGPYVKGTDLYLQMANDMNVADPSNGLAGKTTRISGFYFVA